MADFIIDKEGTWYYRGMEMTRRDIVRLFYRHLQSDESGRCFIEIGTQRCPVEVEDVAYVVWAIFRAGSKDGFGSGVFLLLSDDSVEELDPATLRIGKDNVPYCRVKNGRYEARFSTSSYYQLAELITYDPRRDGFLIALKGQVHYIPEEPKDPGRSQA